MMTKTDPARISTQLNNLDRPGHHNILLGIVVLHPGEIAKTRELHRSDSADEVHQGIDQGKIEEIRPAAEIADERDEQTRLVPKPSTARIWSKTVGPAIDRAAGSARCRRRWPRWRRQRRRSLGLALEAAPPGGPSPPREVIGNFLVFAWTVILVEVSAIVDMVQAIR